MSDQLDVNGLPPYTQVESMNSNGVFNAFGPTDFIKKFFYGGVIPAVGSELIMVLTESIDDNSGNTTINILLKEK